MNALAAWWSARPARERLVLGTAIALAAALLLVAFLWLPLERSRSRLAAELPRLALATAAMQAQAAEVARVRALPSSTPATTAPLAALASSGALARGLPGAELAAVDDRRLRLKGADLAFGGLLEWIAAAQSAHALRVESARIEALPAAGRVRAELLLARP